MTLDGPLHMCLSMEIQITCNTELIVIIDMYIVNVICNERGGGGGGGRGDM